MRLKLRSRVFIAAAAVALVGGTVVATGIATATTPTTTYHACLSTVRSVLYNVNLIGAPRCLRKDLTVGWNQTGPAGTNGNTVLNGTAGPPASTVGNNGDFYIDTATDTLYGPKAGGTWPTPGTSLVGTQGPAGTNGTDGNTILNGTSAPGPTVGNNGDFYIDTATDTLYGPKAGGTWPTPGTSLVGQATQCEVTDVTTPTTPATSTDLQAAINAARSGDTLDMTGECVGNFTIPSAVTLTLMGMPTAALNGDNSGTVLTVSSGSTVTLTNLLLTGGQSSSNGYSGGGVINDGTLTLNGTAQVDNNAGTYGGGILNWGTLTLNDTSHVNGNTAVVGGGIYNFGTLTLNGSSQVDGNTAGDGGGGIFNFRSFVTLNDSAQVDGNTAGDSGGIDNYVGTVTLNDSAQVDGNTSNTDGGGIDNIGAVTLNGSSHVNGNTAGSGGGIYNGHGGVTLNDSTQVDGNTAGSGGGIYNGGDGDIALNGSAQVDGNTSNTGGGGIYNASTVTLHDTSEVTHNTAGSGGGIYNAGTLDGCTTWTGAISPNTPDDPPTVTTITC